MPEGAIEQLLDQLHRLGRPAHLVNHLLAHAVVLLDADLWEYLVLGGVVVVEAARAMCASPAISATLAASFGVQFLSCMLPPIWNE